MTVFNSVLFKWRLQLSPLEEKEEVGGGGD